jgi:ABC-2 type transport system permease protein
VNKLPSLIRVSLKANFGLAVLHHRLFKEKKDIWLVPLVGLGLIGLVPTLYGYFKLIKNVYDGLRPLGQQPAILTFGILTGQFLVLLFGLYYVISAFYFSRDLEMLVPLPFKPFQVMLSKFAVILVNEYLTIMAFVLPVIVYYGILAKAGLPYWLQAPIVYLLMPVIPLAVVSILVIGMMRAVNLSRKKDALIIVGSLLLITAGIGLQFVFNRSGSSQPDPQAMIKFFTSPDSLLNKIGASFPPSIWATKALAGGWTKSGLTNLLLYAGVSLLFFIGIVVISERLFYRGLIGIGEISGRKKALSRTEMSRRISSGRRPVRAIFMREWRIMNRTPIFLLNGVLAVVIVPLLFVIMAKTGIGRGVYTSILNGTLTSANPLLVMLIAACFMAVCSSLNGTASSTFSREGAQFWMSKIIPVSPREQVIAKFLHSYMIALLGIAASTIVFVAFLHLELGTLAPAWLLALAGSVPMTALGMIIDLARPLLHWTNPQKAIKQNLNVLFGNLADIGILVILGYLSSLLIKTGISRNALLIVLLSILVVLGWASLRVLLKYAERRYGEIET